MREDDLNSGRFGYTGYLVSKSSRRELRNLYPEKYAQFVGHHITHEFGVNENTADIPEAGTVRLVGYADSGDGIECFVAEVNGSTVRPDGGTCHLTWSFDPNSGYKLKHSNDLLKRDGWENIDPINIDVEPQFFAMKR